jgi:hypothetical protein
MLYNYKTPKAPIAHSADTAKLSRTKTWRLATKQSTQKLFIYQFKQIQIQNDIT